MKPYCIIPLWMRGAKPGLRVSIYACRVRVRNHWQIVTVRNVTGVFQQLPDERTLCRGYSVSRTSFNRACSSGVSFFSTSGGIRPAASNVLMWT